MAEHHDDHGNTVAGWFLTVSWIVVWLASAVAIIAGLNFLTCTLVGLGASVVCAVVAGVMKKAGLGRKAPRPRPMTREEYEAKLAQQTKNSEKATV